MNAYKLNIISEEFYNFYNKTLNIRNTFAHQYKKPITKELVKLYKNNKTILENFKVFIEKRLKENIKNNRKDLLESILEDKINRSIDLVNIEELPKNIQLQILSRNKRVVFKENENINRYLYELDKWYKEDYPFWLKMQRVILAIQKRKKASPN